MSCLRKAILPIAAGLLVIAGLTSTAVAMPPELGLTTQQQEQLEAIAADARNRIREIEGRNPRGWVSRESQAEIDGIMRNLQQRRSDVLTPQQRLLDLEHQLHRARAHQADLQHVQRSLPEGYASTRDRLRQEMQRTQDRIDSLGGQVERTRMGIQMGERARTATGPIRRPDTTPPSQAPPAQGAPPAGEEVRRRPTRSTPAAGPSSTGQSAAPSNDTRNLPTGASGSDTGRPGPRSSSSSGGNSGHATGRPEPAGPRPGGGGASERGGPRSGLGSAEDWRGRPRSGAGSEGGSRSGGGLELAEESGGLWGRARNLLGTVARGVLGALEVQQVYEGVSRFVRNKEQNEVIGAALRELDSERSDLQRQFARSYPELNRSLEQLANLPPDQVDRLIDRRSLGDDAWRAAHQMIDQFRQHNDNEATIREGIQTLMDRRRENLNPFASDRETGAFADLANQLRQYVPGEVDRYERDHSAPAESGPPTTHLPRMPWGGSSGSDNPPVAPVRPGDDELRRAVAAQPPGTFPDSWTDEDRVNYVLANRGRHRPDLEGLDRPPPPARTPVPEGPASTGGGSPPYLSVPIDSTGTERPADIQRPNIQGPQSPVSPPADTTAQDRYRQHQQAYQQWLSQRSAYQQWLAHRQAYDRWLAQQSAQQRNSKDWLARQQQHRRWQAYQQAYRQWLNQQQQHRRWLDYQRAYRQWQARQRARQQQLAQQRAAQQRAQQHAARQQASQLAQRAAQQGSRSQQATRTPTYGPSRSLGIVPDQETVRRQAARRR